MAERGSQSPTTWWRREAPAVITLAGVAAIHVVMLLAGHRTYFAANDNSTQFWPWYQKEASTLHSGAFSVWDGNTLIGHSFVGETQTGVFYPINIVWLLLFGSGHGIGTRALDVLVVFHLWLASVGFYALCRSFHASRIAACIAGVVFAYTGAVYARTTAQTAIFFGLTFVPWAMYFAHRQLETDRLRYAAAAGVAIGLAVLAGHFQPPFHAVLLVALLYLLAGAERRGWRAEVAPRLRAAATTGVAALVVAGPQLAYSLPYLDRAYRFVGAGPPIAPGGKVSFSVFSTLYTGGLGSAVNLLDPQSYPIPDSNDLFIGLGALAVLVVGLVLEGRDIGRRLGRYRAALAAAVVIGALALLGPWTLFPRVLYELPLVTEVRELGRYVIMIEVVLCLLLALSLDALRARWASASKTIGRAPGVVAALGALVVVNGVYLTAKPVPGADRWFGEQLLLGGLALLALGAARPAAIAARHLAATRGGRWALPAGSALLALVGVAVIAGSLQNTTRLLGQTSSPLYPPRYYAMTPVIGYVERACAGHRTLPVGTALPTNVGDVYRQIRTQNGYGATLHVPFFDFIESTQPYGVIQTRLLDERCIVSDSPVSAPGYHAMFHDAVTGATVYVNPLTSAVNTVGLVPVKTTILSQRDRDLSYRVDLSRSTRVIVSAIVYPGWVLHVDGHDASVGAFRIGSVPVFPEVTLPAGVHTVSYRWSGLPA